MVEGGQQRKPSAAGRGLATRWAAIVSAPASSPSFDSSSGSRMINSSVSAETACGLQCGRRDRGSSRSACAKIAT